LSLALPEKAGMQKKIKLIIDFRDKLLGNLEKVILGKTEALDLVIMCLLCRGHLLIDDVPGVGKTYLSKTLAISLGSRFHRIQFTPDMLPSDITGLSFYNQATRKIEFRPGPVFADVILADEINRATPKTQSALLEAMEERQVTIDGITHSLPTTFMVIATQNPIEYEGTFALPEAQLDRFLMKIQIGYPSKVNELKMLESQQTRHPIENIKSVTGIIELLKVQSAVRQIYVSETVEQYIVRIVNSTREKDEIYLGASPRGSLGLYRAAQVFAALQGREFVTPDDVKFIAVPVLSHRIIIQPGARVKHLSAQQLIEEVLSQVPVES
jgi:MoxR-like ATPase